MLATFIDDMLIRTQYGSRISMQSSTNVMQCLEWPS